jgi:DNA-binding MarR family transcriptional regulator
VDCAEFCNTCILQVLWSDVNQALRELAKITGVEPAHADRYRRGLRFVKLPAIAMKGQKIAPLPLENWIGYRFGLVSARLGEFVAPMYTTRHGLTVPGWRSLAVIARYQPLTAKQLGTLTSSDAFKVARAIELLVRRGLIHRDVDKTDRRRAKLRLTAEGRKVYRDIEKFVIRVENELAAALGASELATLRQSLDKLDRQIESRIKAQDWEKFLKG